MKYDVFETQWVFFRGPVRLLTVMRQWDGPSPAPPPHHHIPELSFITDFPLLWSDGQSPFIKSENPPTSVPRKQEIKSSFVS